MEEAIKNTIESHNESLLQKYSLVYILKNFKVSATFAKDYLLNEKYAKCDEDENITVSDILLFQPHLKEKDIIIIQ